MQYISYLSMITPCSRHGQYKSFSPVFCTILPVQLSSSSPTVHFAQHWTLKLFCGYFAQFIFLYLLRSVWKIFLLPIHIVNISVSNCIVYHC